MERHGRRWLAGLAALFLMLPGAWAGEVTAVGEGATRQAAINEALRAAVEQALGTLLQSDSQVSEGKLDFDRVVSASAGYVKSYDILAEGKDPIEEVFKVKLRAQVDDHKLKDALTEFMQDGRFQKAFQQTAFDQRRVMVLYQKRSPTDLEEEVKGVRTAIDLVEDRLVSYGFRIFLPEQLERIKGNLQKGMIDNGTALKLAQQENADAVVLINLDAGYQTAQGGFVPVMTTLAMKAFDVTTGELFANVSQRGKAVTRGGDYGLADGAAKVVLKIGGPAADDMVKKIVQRFSASRDKFSVLVVQDVSMDKQDHIEDLVNDQGWRYRVARQRGSYLELEVFSDMDPSALRRAFRRAAQKAGLALQSVEIVGNRIVFSGR